MQDGVGLAVIALDEAEPFHRVEELDRPAGLLASQLTLRSTAAAGSAGPAATAPLDCHRLRVEAKVRRRDPPAAIDQRELERLAVGEVGQAGLLDRKDMGQTCPSAHTHTL